MNDKEVPDHEVQNTQDSCALTNLKNAQIVTPSKNKTKYEEPIDNINTNDSSLNNSDVQSDLSIDSVLKLNPNNDNNKKEETSTTIEKTNKINILSKRTMNESNYSDDSSSRTSNKSAMQYATSAKINNQYNVNQIPKNTVKFSDMISKLRRWVYYTVFPVTKFLTQKEFTANEKIPQIIANVVGCSIQNAMCYKSEYAKHVVTNLNTRRQYVKRKFESKFTSEIHSKSSVQCVVCKVPCKVPLS